MSDAPFVIDTNGLHPHVKLWLERDGRLALSDFRMRLLEHVAETGSLARAAGRMHLSYRRAWGKIKELEENLGVDLVASESGGAGGGHTSLTPEGRRLLAAYQTFQRRVDEAMREAFDAAFGGNAPG